MPVEKPDDPLRFVLAGCLNRDTILPISGPPQIDVFGGNLAYAAVGLNIWGGKAGLLARVGPDYPLEWLNRLKSAGFELSGIKVIRDDLDTRRFLAHDDTATTSDQNPIQHFADRGLPYPRSMLGYPSQVSHQVSRTTPLKVSIQISDIPASYLEASAVHICPIDYHAHMILPSIFRQQHASTITLASYPGYMDPAYWEELPGMLADLTAFITPESEVRNLFLGRQTDLWEMAGVLAGFGPEYVIIQTDTLGYYLVDRVAGKRWVVPQYSAQVVDPTGERDAFAGGFLAGYREHYDPVEAALMGSIAASVVVEGSGVYYGLDALPRLIEARRMALRDLVRLV